MLEVAASWTNPRSRRAARARRFDGRLVAEAAAGEALGARWLRVFGGGTWGDALTPEGAATVRAHRAWWAQRGAERGWTIDLILELHDAFSGTPQVLAFFARAGGPMPLLWDTHHTWKTAGEAAADTWKQLGAHGRHVHVKDSVPQPSDKLLYTYVAPGAGEFPLQKTLTLLADANFLGVVSLERERHWHPALAPLADVLPDWDRVTERFRRASG